MEEELKPCPFCGKKANLVNKLEGEISLVYGCLVYDICCETEGCFLQSGADWHLPKEVIIDLWNNRYE